MSRRKQSNPKPLLKNESENQGRDMAILQQDRADISSEIDDEQSTVASDDITTTMQPQSINEIDKKELPSSASPESLEMNSNSHSPIALNTPIASPALSIDIKNERHTNAELPKLRLNITLASDPALQPEAKDIQSIRANTVESYETESNGDDDMRAESTSPMLVHDDEPPPEKRRRDESSSFRSVANKFALNLASNVGTVNSSADTLPRVPAFVCAPCGIKFSSKSTLEAHQTFYCSHSSSKKDTEDTNNPLKAILVDDGGNGDSAQAKNVRTVKQYGCNQCSYSADKKVSLNRHMRMHQTSPTSSSVTSNGDDCSSQVQQTPQQQPSIQIHQIDRYCTDCDIRFSSTKTYRAHKQHYCSGRHRDGPALPIPTTAKPLTPKTAYPKTGEDSSKTQEAISSSQPFLALPTKPIIIVPYSMIRGASVLPAPLTMSPNIQNPDMNCYILQNGSLQPIAQAISLASTSESTSPRAQTPVAKASSQSNDSDSAPNHVDNSKPTKRKDTQNREGNTTPLDLSVRRLSLDRAYRERSASISSSISGDHHRMSVDALTDGKENVLLNSSNSASPEQIVCAPSLPGSPPLTPSPKRNSCSPRGILTISPSSISSSLHLNQSNAQASTILRPLLVNELTRITDSNTVAAVLNAHASASQHLIDELALNISTNHNVPMPISKTTSPIAASNNATKKPLLSGSNQPHIFVKQGVSKCKECNIVFCKYENYLAHKKHYCSARNVDEATDGKTKPSPPTSPSANNASGNSSTSSAHGAYQQLICAACGIKFTSLDNLQAHQMYYCPKRIEVPAAVKDKCTKCKTIHEASQACPTNQNLYKCPICEVVSANSTESRKHIESHSGVRGYRCSICRYKGNTIRGMRTHIRMHFDKKSSDFNEENYISCEIEEDNGDIVQTPTASVVSTSVLATNAKIVQKENSQSSPPIHCCDKCGFSSTFEINVIRHATTAHPTPGEKMPSQIGAAGESVLCEQAEIERNNKAKVIVKTETHEVKSQPSANDFEDKIDSLPGIIKTEHIDVSDNEDDDKHSDIEIEPSHLKPYHRLDAEAVKKSILISDTSSISMNALNLPGAGTEMRYCHVCDIKFNYLNTFIAHKKFYCKSLQNDIDASSATANQPAAVITTARSSPNNQTSVVT